MLNAAGLTLATIRGLLPCARSDSVGFLPCPEFKHVVRRRLAELDQQIAALSDSRHLPSDYLAHSETPQ